MLITGSMRRAFSLLLTSSVVAMAIEWAISRGLPDRVALHFGPNGVPDRWGGRGELILTFVSVHVGVTLMMAVLVAVLGWIPPRLFNLPHRDYWLSDLRRESTLGALGTRFAIFGIALNTFLAYTAWLSTLAQSAVSQRLNLAALWVGMGVFLAFVAGWIVEILRYFSRPPRGSSGAQSSTSSESHEPSPR